MKLEVFSDIACPWCFIGKRRLARALAQAPHVETTWRAYLLQPALPADGVPAEPFFVEKFGGVRGMEAAFERVTAVGRSEGIAFNFGAMKRAPNTRLAHRCVKVCDAWGASDAAVGALFSAHFEEGANLSALGDVLAALERHQVAVPVDEVEEALLSGGGEQAVGTDLARAATLGVSAVPLFLAPSPRGAFAVEGAQPPEFLLELLRRAEGAGDERG